MFGVEACAIALPSRFGLKPQPSSTARSNGRLLLKIVPSLRSKSDRKERLCHQGPFLSCKLFALNTKLAGQGGIGLGQLHSRGVTPESFQVVELPHRLIEDMDDHIGEIHQHPLTSEDTLDRERRKTGLTEVFFDSLRDALDLTIGSAGANDEIVGDGGDLTNLHQDKVVGFFLKRKTAEKKGLVPRIGSTQPRYRPSWRRRYRPLFLMQRSTAGGTRYRMDFPSFKRRRISEAEMSISVSLKK